MASLNLLTPDGRPKERVLVTGATGFLGAHCVDQLLRQHYIVRGSVRDLQDSAKINPIKALARGLNDRLELVEADLFLKDSWDQAVSGCDYVIHVASPVPAHAPKHAEDIITPALDGTLAVLEACRRSGHVKKVVITGAALNVYDTLVAPDVEIPHASSGTPGNTRDEQRVVHTEDEWTDLQGPHGDLHNVFVQSKVRAEKAAWHFIETVDALNNADVAASNSSEAVAVTTNNSISAAGASTAAAAADTSTGSMHRLHSDSVSRLLIKQSRHKSSVTGTSSSNMRHLCCSFPLTTILPVLMVGPCIHGHNALAAQLIHNMLCGGAEMPIIPGIAIEICDVRDVARAHVLALKTAASNSKRILVFTESIWLRDIAAILGREFLAYGYRVPTRPAPRWFTRLYTFARRDLSWLRRRKPNRKFLFSNDRMQQILGITPTPVEQTLVDMAHSLILRGDIKMTPLYKRRMDKLAASDVGKNGRKNSGRRRSVGQRRAKDDVDKKDNSGIDGDACSVRSISTPGSSSSSLGGLLMQSRENSANDLGADAIDCSKEKTMTVGQLAEEFEVLPDGRVIPSPKKSPRVRTEISEQILKAAADVDDDEAKHRKGEMKSHHNIDSDDEDPVEEAAETAMVAAEEGEKYKY